LNFSDDLNFSFWQSESKEIDNVILFSYNEKKEEIKERTPAMLMQRSSSDNTYPLSTHQPPQ